MKLFEDRDPQRVPVWFMRQAGRYHSHYQNIKKSSDFMTMCKTPEFACEVTLGPIQDFGFDAAILFSDLLFPLEHLGMGLNYQQGPPRLAFHLKEEGAISRLKQIEKAEDFYAFQGKACELLRKNLPTGVDLLGFVGAPFTLYTYATEGSHAGSLFHAKRGLYTGLYQQFYEKLFPSLMTEIQVQIQGGAQAICLFDTAAGELGLKDYQEIVLPSLRKITAAVKKEFPQVRIIYYSKHTHLRHLLAIEDSHIDALGVDWRHSLPEVFQELGRDYFIQGNFDPCWLHLPPEKLKENLKWYLTETDEIDHRRWISGLGHGVLIETPEENVRTAVKVLQTRSFE
jgi:uroporphyrinogen decarboxylase